MAKKIVLEFTEKQFIAFMNLIDSASSVFQEIEEEQKNVNSIDRMLKANGYKRKYN